MLSTRMLPTGMFPMKSIKQLDTDGRPFGGDELIGKLNSNHFNPLENWKVKSKFSNSTPSFLIEISFITFITVITDRLLLKAIRGFIAWWSSRIQITIDFVHFKGDFRIWPKVAVRLQFDCSSKGTFNAGNNHRTIKWSPMADNSFCVQSLTGRSLNQRGSIWSD